MQKYDKQKQSTVFNEIFHLKKCFYFQPYVDKECSELT